jgi:hypothetical protein
LAALWERDHNYFSARSSDLIFPELRTVTDTRRPAFRVADARCGPGGRGPGARSMGHWPQRANVWRTVTSLGRDKTTKKSAARVTARPKQLSNSMPISFSDDYFMVTKRRRRLEEWSWEIQRRSTPIGVRLHANGFKSELAAKLAGEKALRELLDGLAQEKNV